MNWAANSSCRVSWLVTGRSYAYGDGDATYQACGGEPGIRALVETFYALMDTLPEAKRIRALHPSDLSESIGKLVCFLCGWTGGPKRYAEIYGPIRLPQAHIHLPIGEGERDAWLFCMEHALVDQPFGDDLKNYLLEQLHVPAERIRLTVESRQVEGKD